MNTSAIKFKTNINCNGCKSKIAPILNEMEKIEHWDVDLTGEDKTLLVIAKDLQAAEIIDKLKQIGFTAEKM